MMYKAEFELEAIIPIFMRGADQRKAEIRAASIKGLMRWWFRALAGNYFGNDIVGLRRAEDYVFGSTGQRSRVVVEVVNITDEKRRVIFRYGKPCVVDRKSPSNQLKYLWFSINLLARKCKLNEYYPAGTKFTIRMRASDESSFKIALVSLWALVSLGGIGFRSRRGAGSIRFCGGDLEEFDNLNLKWRFKNHDELKESIEQAIKSMGTCLKREKIEVRSARYPILSSRTSVVALWDPEVNDPIQALSRFQNEYQKFRRTIQKSDRIIFGLPMNLRGRGTNSIRDRLSEIRNSRKGSPMIMGLVNTDNKLYVRLVKFRTEPYHPISNLNELANWSVVKKFNEKLRDYVVFGSLEVFK